MVSGDELVGVITASRLLEVALGNPMSLPARDSDVAVVALSVFVIAYLLDRHRTGQQGQRSTRRRRGGVAAGRIADDVFYSRETGVDWNVIFLLLGMMVIVGILRRTGVFEYTAIWAYTAPRVPRFG